MPRIFSTCFALLLAAFVSACAAANQTSPPAASPEPAADPAPLDAADYITFRTEHPLHNARLRFERDKVGTVVFLGGSITAGPGWRDHVCQDLQARFPDTQFTFINAGIPSTGSITAAFRFERDVLAHQPVDLLFEEAAVNDAAIGFTDLQQKRGMEGVVRHALLANPRCDIVVMHFVDPGKIRDYTNGQTPQTIQNHEAVTDGYNLTTLNLAKEVTDRIANREFTWEGDFKDLHPSPFGHKLYANTISTMFDLAWAAPPEELPPTAQPADHDLPDPLDPLAYFAGALLPPGAATDLVGFTAVEAWKPADKARTRPGFVDVPMLVATDPGDALSLTFTGTAAGIWVAAGPDAGIIESRIDQGPWKTTDLFTQHSRNLHLPRLYLLAQDLPPGQHTLQLRLTPQYHAQSTGTACRIVNFVVNE